MNKTQFLKRFEDAIEQVFSYTQVFCFNKLSPDYKFILVPNMSATPVVLDDIELAYIKTLTDLERTPLSVNQVLDMVCKNDRVPMWINMSVYEAREDITLIEMICARRLRSEESLVYKVDKHPPFHILAPLPPQTQKADGHIKFDVNWRLAADNKKSKPLFSRIKSYFQRAV